jgi:hypothetical protein
MRSHDQGRSRGFRTNNRNLSLFEGKEAVAQKQKTVFCADEQAVDSFAVCNMV